MQHKPKPKALQYNQLRNQPATSQQLLSNNQTTNSSKTNQPTSQLLLVSMEKLVDMLTWFAGLLVVLATGVSAIVLGTVVHQMVAVVIACCVTALFVRLADYVYLTICSYEHGEDGEE